jgi:hypothetical protein
MENNEWDNPKEVSSLTLEQMDKLVTDLAESKEAYEEASKASKALHAVYEGKRKLVLDALNANGRNNFETAGVGKVSITRKEIYRVPANVEAKTKLFNYIKQKYGGDILMEMASINHMTLNTWANKETETGDVMEIPGLELPTVEEIISFRRK